MYLLPINGIIGEDFKTTDLLMHLNAAKDEQSIKLLINSPGGFVDEAERMRDAIENTGKVIVSENNGDVASAAVELFLIPKSIELRRFNPEKGVMLIHMPFLDPKDGGATGTAEEIQEVADNMKKLEKNLASFYAKKTGTSANILSGFMKENTPLTEEQIQSLGFATIVKQEFKAVAFYNKENNMEQKEVNEKLTGIEALLNKVMNFIKPKALMVQDTNGVSLDFGSEIQDPAQIVVGVKVMADGKPAEGNYVMPGGETYVCAAGELKEIIPAESEMDALKKENEELKQQLTTSKAELDTFKASAEKQITEVTNQFKAFRAQFSDGKEKSFSDNDEGDEGKPKNRSAFKKTN